MPNSNLLTKILATLGPASESVDHLVRLIEEGARVFRVNFSHGTFDDFAQRIANVREAAKQTGVPIGVLGDLSGPKIRVERVPEPFDLTPGDWVEFTTLEMETRKYEDTGVSVLSTTYPAIVHDVQPGDRVFINDGAVRLLCIDNPYTEFDQEKRLHCRVTAGGTVSNKKGINLPDSAVSAPSLTDWDRQCVSFAVEHEVDFLALSFVRKAQDLVELKQLLAELGHDSQTGSPLPVIAKVEKPEAIEDIEAICDEADGIMVARGDLGVEMEPSEVPVLQKKIISTAHAYGKPVIVATQMLESMISNSHPTRAEVSDVANAIHEGADAVMLSGETAVGKFPKQAVAVMAMAARNMEAFNNSHGSATRRPPSKTRDSKYRTAALAHAVSVIVEDLEPKYVVNWSELGGGARYLSQNRLPVPIIAVSSNRRALRQMSLMFGVTAVRMERPDDAVEFLTNLDALMLERGWAEPGDPLVIVKGEPLGIPGVTNQIRIHYIGDVCRVTWRAKN